MDLPETKYATTDDGVHLAYKVFGDGPVDFLFFWQDPVAFDACFEHPGHLRYWRFITAFARVIGYDRRGIGASDPAPTASLARREVWLKDAITVMDAVGVGPVVVQGEGSGGHAAIALAAAHPERIRGLVLVNSYARYERDANFAFGLPPGDIDGMVEVVGTRWGTGEIVALAVPHLAGDPSFAAFCARFERMAASPATAAACVRAAFTSDVRDLLDSINVPTLVVYTGDLTIIGPEHSRFLASHITGATLIESPTESFWGFDPGARLVVQEFISGITAELSEDRELLAVLFTDIVSSTEHAARVGDGVWRETLEDYDASVVAEVERSGGRVVKQTGDGHLAAFARPTDAIRAAVGIRAAAQVHGVKVRAGLHFGEVTSRSDGDVTGSAVNIAARVMTHAGPSEVVVSSTVKDLVAGSGIVFVDRGSHTLKGVQDEWRLFAVES